MEKGVWESPKKEKSTSNETGSCTTSGQITGQSHLCSQREIFPGKMSGISAALSEKRNEV